MKKFRLNVTDCDWMLRKSDNAIQLTMNNPAFEVSELNGGYAVLGYDYLIVDHNTDKVVRVDVNLQPLREQLEPVLKAAKANRIELVEEEAVLCTEVLDMFARSQECGFAEFSVVKM